MDSIHRDARHTDVTTLRFAPVLRRSFAGWAMAYSGPSDYLAGRIAPLIGCEVDDDDVRTARLITLMTGLDRTRQAGA